MDAADARLDNYLQDYCLLVESLAEMVGQWDSLDEEERAAQAALFLPTWGRRQVLGRALQTGQLTSKQLQELTKLDRELIYHAEAAWKLFEFVPRWLFEWGTPLGESDEPLLLEVRPATLLAWSQPSSLPAFHTLFTR